MPDRERILSVLVVIVHTGQCAGYKAPVAGAIQGVPHVTLVMSRHLGVVLICLVSVSGAIGRHEPCHCCVGRYGAIDCSHHIEVIVHEAHINNLLHLSCIGGS